MADLWQEDRLYNFLRPYVDFCTRGSYHQLKVEGQLPEDGAVIIAPNHTNTLMDALVVLQTRKAPTAFGARADIFRNPSIARILRFLRIVPMVRSRDGLHNVERNRETFREVAALLQHRLPFCLFSEGRHRPMHSLLPIQKGIARIALESAAHGHTYIVPTGIDYSDFFHYRGTCRLVYGDPFDVNGFLAGHPALGEAEVYRRLRTELFDRIKGLIRYVPDDEHYEENWRKMEAAGKTGRNGLRLLAVLSAPLFILSAVLAFPMWGTAEYLCRYKITDRAFHNTARYGAKLIGTPLLLLVWATIFYLTLPPLVATGLLVCFLFSYSFFYDWLNWIR